MTDRRKENAGPVIMVIGLALAGSMTLLARAEPPQANRGVRLAEDNIENKPIKGALRQTAAPTTGRSATSFSWQVWGALGLVLLVIVGVAAIIRKAYPGARMFASLPVVQVLGRTHLSPKQTLAMVKVDQRLLLLGVTEHNVNTLLTISDTDEISRLLTQLEQHHSISVTHSFRQLFAGERTQFADAHPPGGAKEPGSETSQENSEQSVLDLKAQLSSLLNKVNRLKGMGSRG